MCKHHLLPVSGGMMNEIPSYGSECSDVAMSFAPQDLAAATVPEPTKEDDSMTKATEAAAWMCFVLILFLTSWYCYDHCKKRSDRITLKTEEMKSDNEAPQTERALAGARVTTEGHCLGKKETPERKIEDAVDNL